MTLRFRPRSAGFPTRLREAREACDLTQEQLAHLVGYSKKQAISNLEQGKRGVTTVQVERIAAALGITPQWLAFGSEGQGGDASSSAGSRLRAAREAAGLTHRALAPLLGYASGSAISDLEVGSRGLDLYLCEMAAQVLQVSPEWLAFGAGVAPEWTKS